MIHLRDTILFLILKPIVMKLKNLFPLLVCASLFMACTNDNPDTLMEDMPNDNAITYQQNVKSIIDNNCISCHAATPRNGAPMSLVTYEQVKNAIQNRGLLNRISLNNGNSLLMPQGGPRLPQVTIDIVSQWQQDGLLEQ
jgi:uncharacterized membrane protein